MNILVVEDERTDFVLIEHAIEQLEGGYRIIHATGCRDAARMIEDQSVTLALVDILLPDGDGFKISEHLKARQIPYIMVSSRSLPENAVQGLRSGAEDYIRKPFDVNELTARLERVLLRVPIEAPTGEPTLLEENEGVFRMEDHRIELTPIQQQIFSLLRRRFDTYVPTNELIESVWGTAGLETSKGALRTYITHIRKKLSKADIPLSIVSKWGRGYRLTENNGPGK